MFHLFRRTRLVPNRRNVPIRRTPLLLELLEDRLVPSTLTVQNNNDTGAGSLRATIAAANSGDTINFKATLSGQTIQLNSGQLVITKSLSIQGLGSNKLTVEGIDTSRAFYINGGGTPANVTISGLKITNDGSPVSGRGGGILLAGLSDHLTLMNSIVTGIFASGSGGGVASTTGSNGSLKIQGSTITGNYARGDDGGGVYAENGTTTITGSTITNNGSEDSGGGVNVDAGKLSISGGSTITGNVAGNEGGGVYFGENSNAVSLTITGSTISGNTAGRDGGGIADYHGYLHVQNSTISGNMMSGNEDGGGIAFKGSTFLIEGSQINNNTYLDSLPTANNGGGLYLRGTGTIRTTTISGNTATASGGGVYFTGNGKLTIQSSTISGNTSEGHNDYGGGGGICVEYGSLVLVNSTISGNSADATETGDGGGGVYFYGGTTQRQEGGGGISGTFLSVNSTIANNHVTSNSGGGDGGGIFLDGGTATLNNTIVANNTLINTGADPVSTVFDDLFRATDSDDPTTFNASYSLIRVGSNQINGVKTHNIFGVDPKLGPLQNNGGPTATLALLAGSLAIDHGSNALAVDPATGLPLQFDQRGPGFPRIENGIVDIGAFEVQVPSSGLNRRWNR